MGGTLAQGQAHAQAISRKLHGDEFDLSDTQGLQEVILGMKALQATHTARRSKLGQSGMTAAERITGKGGFSSVGDEDEQWVTDTINGPTMRYGLNQEFKLEGTIESWSKAYEWSKKYRDNLGGLSQIMVQHAAELDKIEKRWDEMQAKHLTPTAAEMADQVRYPQLLEKVQLESVEASIKRRRNRTRDFLPRGLRDEMLAEDYSDQGGQIVTAYDNRTDPITGSEVAPERIRERRVSRLGPRAAAAYQRDQQIGKIALSKSAKGSSVKIDGRTVLMAASMWDAKSVGDAVANVQEEYGLNVEPTNIMLARMKIQADSEAAIGLLHATALPGDNLGIARRQIEIMKKAADDSFSAGTRSTEESVQNEINKRSLDDKLKSMALQEETLRKRLPVQWRAQAGLTAAEQAAQLKQIGSRLESPDLEPARIRTRHDASIAALAGFREAMSPTMTGIPLEQFRNTVTVQEKAVDSEKAKEEEEFRVQRELQRRQFHAAGITEEAQYGVGRMRRWIWPDQARSPEYNEQMLRRESTAFEQALPDRHLPAQQTTFEREQLQRRQADSRNELAFGNWRQWQSSTIQNQQGENQLRAITERSHILPGDDAKLAALTYEDRIRDAEKLNALTNDRITMEQDERQAEEPTGAPTDGRLAGERPGLRHVVPPVGP